MYLHKGVVLYIMVYYLDQCQQFWHAACPQHKDCMQLQYALDMACVTRLSTNGYPRQQRLMIGL